MKLSKVCLECLVFVGILATSLAFELVPAHHIVCRQGF